MQALMKKRALTVRALVAGLLGLACHAPGAAQEPVGQPAAAPMSAAQWLTSGQLDIKLRNYAEYLEIGDGKDRHAWVQSVQANYRSPFTDGPIGLGFDISPYAALKLDGGRGTRNMVHVGPNGSGAGRTAWAYLGGYALKAEVAGVLVKHGLQSISNPFLDPYDIRALPPSFKGTSATATPAEGLELSAGSFNAMITRGSTFLQPLATSYGGIPFSRQSYVGAEWQYDNDGRVTVYTSRAHDVWNQHFVALARSAGDLSAVRWTANANGYRTRDQGARLQGAIDNKAYSLALTGAHGASSLILGYQRVVGPQFFDFTQETAGIFLANSMGVDFNAPQERSVQLRYRFDGAAAGYPGVQTMLWAIGGWGADGGAEAARYADPAHVMHGLYWKAGAPIGGGHREYGFRQIYIIQSGALKATRVMLLLTRHAMDSSYPSRPFRDVRVMVDFPVKVF